MTVRAAIKRDVGAVVEMGQAMWEESPRYRGGLIRYDPEKAQAACEFLMERDDLCLLVSTAQEYVTPILPMQIPVAFAVGAVYAPLWSRDKQGWETEMYVKPPYRRGMRLYRLATALEGWARDQGAREMNVGVSTGIDNEMVASFYRRLDYHDAQIGLVKVL